MAFKKTFSYAGFEMQKKAYSNPKIAMLNIELVIFDSIGPSKLTNILGAYHSDCHSFPFQTKGKYADDLVHFFVNVIFKMVKDPCIFLDGWP